MEHITHNKKAFTLIEILVAVTIFVLVVAAAIGIFVSSMQGKERVNQLKEIEDNARYVMEMMSREIRMGYEIASDEADTFDSEIDFVDSSVVSIKLCRADENGNCDSNGDYLAKREESAAPSSNHLITSSKVKITNLIFYVNDFDLTNSPQPRVTISMTVASKDDAVSMDFQTTLSPRIY
ncbi:prepilin-type N-terminal cleavage/methylation domain-containing protein [Candidatus Parcubacteria bacterium]|nr:prepilin-type N-terminal cleavage/methylation domain-containing protein [Candidatus Parcubacteria bacterium]